MTEPQRDNLFISHLKTNAKTGFDGALFPVTVITGPNASGKSTVPVSLAVGLTDRDDDVGATISNLVGLTDESQLAIDMALARPTGATNGSEVFAHAGKLRWVGEKGKKDPKLTITGDGLGKFEPATRGVVISREVQTLIAKGATLRREILLDLVAPPRLLTQVRARLPELYAEAWDALAEDLTSKTEVDKLKEARKLADKRLKEQRAVAKTAPEGSMPDAPDAETIARLAAAVSTARERLGVWRQYQAAVVRRQQIEHEMGQARARMGMQTEVVAQQANDAGLIPVETLEAGRQRIAAARLLLDGDAVNGGTCHGCGTKLTAHQLAAAVNTIASTEGLVRDQLARHAALKHSQQVHSAQSHGAEDPQQALSELQHDHALLDELVATTPPEPSADEIRDADAAHRGALAQHQAQQAWCDQRDTARTAVKDVDALKAVSGAIKAVQTESLDAAVGEFCDRASAVLDGSKLVIKLFDGAKPICGIGLKPRRGKTRMWELLSGRERVDCALAIAAAWCTSRPEPIRLLVIDEWDCDTPSFTRICNKLHEIVTGGDGPTQAIVCKAEITPEAIPDTCGVVTMSLEDEEQVA